MNLERRAIMKKKYVMMFLLVFAFGCASGRTQIIQPKKTGFRNYQVLEITDLENTVGPKVPAEYLQVIPNEIAKKVTLLNLFQAVERVPIPPKERTGTPTLVLKGAIIEYDPGSRGKRWCAGPLGWGKGFMTVQLTALDRNTKEVIALANVGCELQGGFFGGSFSEATKKLVDEAAELIQADY
jgi:hypothetical protein